MELIITSVCILALICGMCYLLYEVEKYEQKDDDNND